MAAEGVNDSSMWFNISPPSGKPRKSSSDDDCVALLNLQEFEKPPLLSFRQVDIGTTERSTLKIFNPNKVKLRLSFYKIPSGFSVKNNSVEIQANAYLDISIFWKPTELGGLRKSVMVNTDLGQRFQFYVQGECVKPHVSKTKKQSLKMSKKRAIPQPSPIKPKAKPEVIDTAAQFLDTNQYQTENLFEELNTNNPLPHTPLRRETFYVDSKRQVLSDVPVFEPSAALINQTLNFEKVNEGILKNPDVQINARKSWSAVAPITTENLLQLPSAIKDSLSSNDTVSSNPCATLPKNPSNINSDETDEFEDSLNEPYVTAPGEPKSSASYQTRDDFQNLDKLSANMYGLNEKGLECSSVVSENPTSPVRNRSASFTLQKSRSKSDSSIITLNRNDETREICQRRVSTAKKDSRTTKFEDLGLTSDLSCITANCNQSAIKIQAWFRGVLARKNVSIIKKEKLKNKAAISIQRLWKGYQLRHNIKDENLNVIRKNHKMAKQNVTRAKTLGQLTRDAVRVILGGRVTDIIQALIHLEIASRLSKSCRNEMVNANITQTLLTLINSCNRSLPHVAVIIGCANLFLNLGFFDDTTDHVWSSINFIDHCLDMMKKFQDRDTLIQNKIATVLVLMCQDNPERLADLKKHSSAEKTIKKLHETCSRKLAFKLKTTRQKDDHSGCACAQKNR